MRPFEDYLKVILKHEGGYVNHSSDPGGETMYGICKRSYPNLDIKNITVEQASEIYYKDYWKPLNIENVSNELIKLHLFDMAVNAGIKPAVKLLQSVLGVVPDGIIGPRSEAKIAQFEATELVDLYKEARIQYYAGLVKKNSKLSVFLSGWINRVNSTKFEN